MPAETVIDNYAPDYFTVLDTPEFWYQAMPIPDSYNRDQVKRYQELVDRLIGTCNGQPIIKLVWMPECFEWWPYPLGSDPVGYKCPTWPALWDKDGNIVAAPRWGLMERCEPEQYLPGWEVDRWVRKDGRLYDAKGPAPSNGYYTPRKRHLAHRDGCCLRGANRENCWGYYVEPNQELLQWIGEHAYISRNDREIQPHTPVNDLPRTQAQLKVKDRLEKERINVPDDVKLPTPFIATGYFKSPNGLYLPENN